MRKNPGIKFMVVLLVIVTLVYATFRIYRSHNTKKSIENTLAGTHWNGRMNEFKSQPDTSSEIIFLGNSLTEGFDLSVFNKPGMLNRGIAGDFTAGVLKRLQEVTIRKPVKIFLMIGINDIIEKVPLEDICANYEQIIIAIQKETPGTRLYIQSVLPVYLRKSGEMMGDAMRQYTESWFTKTRDVNNMVNEYNKRLRGMAEKYNLTYIDLHQHFLEGDALKPELTYDGIHLGKEGYQVWEQQVMKYVNE